MHVVPIIGIIANFGVIYLFAKSKKWTMSLAFLFSVAYTFFSKIVHLEFLPDLVVDSFVYIFGLLVFYNISVEIYYRAIRKKYEA